MQNSGSAAPPTSDSQSEAGDDGWQTRQRRLSEPPVIELGEHLISNTLIKDNINSLIFLLLGFHLSIVLRT